MTLPFTPPVMYNEKARFLGVGLGDTWVTHEIEYPESAYRRPLPTPRQRWWQRLWFGSKAPSR